MCTHVLLKLTRTLGSLAGTVALNLASALRGRCPRCQRRRERRRQQTYLCTALRWRLVHNRNRQQSGNYGWRPWVPENIVNISFTRPAPLSIGPDSILVDCLEDFARPPLTMGEQNVQPSEEIEWLDEPAAPGALQRAKEIIRSSCRKFARSLPSNI